MCSPLLTRLISWTHLYICDSDTLTTSLQILNQWSWWLKAPRHEFYSELDHSFLPTIMTNQCAVGTDGYLKDPSNIVWHNDPDNKCPLPTPGSTTEKSIPVHHFFTGAWHSAEHHDLQQNLSILTISPHHVQSGAKKRLWMVQGPAGELHTRSFHLLVLLVTLQVIMHKLKLWGMCGIFGR